MLNPLIENAYKVLNGEELTYEEALALAEKIEGEDILDLVSLANKVRHKFAGPIVPCSILNAKSGLCHQNCRFCAQAADHHTGIETYPLLPKEEVLEAAGKAWENGVRSFGYVTSGYGYKTATPEFQAILDTLDAVHERYPELKLCVSIGILSRETAGLLAKHHTWRYNMNLQTSPARYAELITGVHTIEDKIQTIKYLQEFGVTICCGGIFGLGENWKDRIDMAFAVKELKVDGSPLNILLPIKGTPLENRPLMSPADAAKAFAVFRLVNPENMIKFAAGRETTMKDFQGLLMLSGLNSMITGGYLTTRGRSVDDDKKFIDQLGGF
ncbi:MAG: biotin synthase BioB [Lentisphaeria bacterium]|nr:biotin synthase BioB [Lentisphaeria bacterium]